VIHAVEDVSFVLADRGDDAVHRAYRAASVEK